MASWLAGCGSVSQSHPSDAAVGTDATANVDAGADGNATIVTKAALFGAKVGARVGGIDLVSTSPDNTVVATGKSDAQGDATIKIASGGSVTAIYRHTADTGTDLITWVGVKSGDTLTFGSRKLSQSGQMDSTLGSQIYTWPAQAGATDYVVFTPCTSLGNGTSLTITLAESSLCHQDPMNVLFAAYDDSGDLKQYGFLPDLTFEAGATVGLSAWSPVQSGTINITGLPPEITSLSGKFFSVINTDEARGMASPYGGTPTGGAFSTTFSGVPATERTVGSVILGRTGFDAIQVLDSFSADTLVQTVASPLLTPWRQGQVTTSAALRTASWFVVASASSTYDGQLLQLTWSHGSTGTYQPFTWSFILPPGETSITYPTLPSPFDDALPLSKDTLNGQIRLFEISSVKGYDMVRAMPSADIMCLDCAVKAGDLQRVVFTPPESSLQ